MAATYLHPQHGMHVSQSWLQQLQNHAMHVVPNFASTSQTAQQEVLWQHFMQGDLHSIGDRALPDDIQVSSWASLPCTGHVLYRQAYQQVLCRLGITDSSQDCLCFKLMRLSISLQRQSTGECFVLCYVTVQQ